MTGLYHTVFKKLTGGVLFKPARIGHCKNRDIERFEFVRGFSAHGVRCSENHRGYFGYQYPIQRRVMEGSNPSGGGHGHLYIGTLSEKLGLILSLHLTLASKVADYRSCPTNVCTHS